jgi:prepilin-type N-terminal cleavage/methylation domain-containing protein
MRDQATWRDNPVRLRRRHVPSCAMPTHPMAGRARARRGTTLIELTIVLVVAGVLLGVAIPRLRDAIARHAVAAGARDVAHLLSTARQIAATSMGGAAVAFDSATSRVRLDVAGREVRTLDLARLRSVTLRATRDSLAYDSRGLGVGAANLSVILTRGGVADTVVVSRLGRVRY